jgi:hypothetical protein
MTHVFTEVNLDDMGGDIYDAMHFPPKWHEKSCYPLEENRHGQSIATESHKSS